MTDINWFDIEKGALPCPFCGEKEIIRQQMWFTDYVEHPEWRFHEDGTRKWTFLKCSRCNNQTAAHCYEHQVLDKWNQRDGKAPETKHGFDWKDPETEDAPLGVPLMVKLKAAWRDKSEILGPVYRMKNSANGEAEFVNFGAGAEIGTIEISSIGPTNVKVTAWDYWPEAGG